MKNAFICFLLGCFFVAGGQRFVRLQQNQLVDSTGKTVQLNAVNVGGWLLWESWIWGAGFTKESEVKTRLQQLLGETGYQHFLEAYYQHFITEKDVAEIARSGFNCIRLPFNHRLFDTANAGSVNGYAIIDNMVQWCRKNKLYLVLDLHAAPGGQSPWFIADPAGPSLWKSEPNKAATIALWKSLATRYGHEQVIAGYDILNEPDISKTADLIGFYNDLIAAIRSVDPNHLLIVEGNKLAHSFKDFPECRDANQIYSFHYYPWTNERRKAPYLKSILQDLSGNRPVWCGEWGEDTPENLKEITALLRQTPNVCGTAFWTWKRVYKNNGRIPLCTVHTSSNWDRLASWLTWKLIKPKQELIEKGIAEFLDAIKIENCTVNSNVRNAVLQ